MHHEKNEPLKLDGREITRLNQASFMQSMLAAAGDRVGSGAHARGPPIRRHEQRRKRVFPAG